MKKYVNLVDLVKSFPTSIYLQKSASIQPRTSLSKFGGKFNSVFIHLLTCCPLLKSSETNHENIADVLRAEPVGEIRHSVPAALAACGRHRKLVSSCGSCGRRRSGRSSRTASGSDFYEVRAAGAVAHATGHSPRGPPSSGCSSMVVFCRTHIAGRSDHHQSQYSMTLF